MSPISSTMYPDKRTDLMTTYLRHWKALCSRLRMRTGSQDLAEEAMQETWLRLSAIEASPQPIHDQQAFLLRVAGNIAIDLVRREQRHTSRCISDEAVLQAVADTYPSPETFAIDRDQLRYLVTALAQLPPKARTALLMSRCDGYTHQQIAKRLRVSESMVARYLAQGLRTCRDHFRRIA